MVDCVLTGDDTGDLLRSVLSVSTTDGNIDRVLVKRQCHLTGLYMPITIIRKVDGYATNNYTTTFDTDKANKHLLLNRYYSDSLNNILKWCFNIKGIWLTLKGEEITVYEPKYDKPLTANKNGFMETHSNDNTSILSRISEIATAEGNYTLIYKWHFAFNRYEALSFSYKSLGRPEILDRGQYYNMMRRNIIEGINLPEVLAAICTDYAQPL